MSRAPLIGLSAYCEEARWAQFQAPAVVLPVNYAEHVAAAGGIPVLLPPMPGIGAAVGRLDGLVLTGGGDIEPGRYGADPDPRTGRVSGLRDAAELELLGAAEAAGLPVLGVCRGMQLVNVARGGTLCQHVAGDGGHGRLRPGVFGSHPVRVAAGTRLAGIMGANGSGVDVPTAHHQAIDQLGEGLVATAWAQDGIIEAVEAPAGGPFLVGVQWHPEAGADLRLMAALVAAASAAAR